MTGHEFNITFCDSSVICSSFSAREERDILSRLAGNLAISSFQTLKGGGTKW